MAKKSYAARSGGRKRVGPRLRKGAMRKAVKNEVKAVLAKEAETKFATFFSGPVPAGSSYPVPVAYPGGAAQQNGLITSNTADIKPLLPQVKMGLEDWNRIGSRIRPTKLVVDIDVALTLTNLQNQAPNNIVVVLYILQHKFFKEYEGLFINNEWTDLLDSGDGFTRSFGGNVQDDNLPVNESTYKLCKKVSFPLRNSGLVPVVSAPPGSANNNAAPLHKRLTIDLTRFIPKTLTYPEPNSGATPEPTVWPTNSSLMFGIGAYNQDLTTQGALAPLQFQLAYTSKLSYKDM